MFAYGALIAFALAHLSVCWLRFKEPDRRRAFKVPVQRAGPRAASCRCRPRSARCCRSRAGSGPSSTTTGRGCSGRSGWRSGLLLYVVYRHARGPVADPAGRGAGRAADLRAGGHLRQHPRAGLRRGARRRHHEHRRPARERRGARGRRPRSRRSTCWWCRCRCRSTRRSRSARLAAGRAALERAKRVGEEYEGVDGGRDARARAHGWLGDRRGGAAPQGRGDRDRGGAALADQGRQRARRDRRAPARRSSGR